MEVSPSEFASRLAQDLESLSSGITPLSDAALRAPRRRSRVAKEQAFAIAKILFPSATSSVDAIVRYEKAVVSLKQAYQIQEEQSQTTVQDPSWESKIRQQGPWDSALDPVSLDGPAALPMPVSVSSIDSLQPFFDFVASNDDFRASKYSVQRQQNAQIDYVEFQRGVFYEDGRMDLCKQVLGPNHISALLAALECNEHIRHFLLGNNIIGPHGARAIAAYVSRHPNRIQTWYLAGCCIDAESFEVLGQALLQSPECRHIWLKRNPLSSHSSSSLAQIVIHLPNLITLDLDQTQLGDIGVQTLFSQLYGRPSSLRNLYLNGNGIGRHSCAAISRFLGNRGCQLQSLYLANNPIGDGVLSLSRGIMENASLLRLSLASSGIGPQGAAILFTSVSLHPCIVMLDVSQSIATEDLDQRYNYITSTAFSSLIDMISRSPSLKSLQLGVTAMDPHTFLRLETHLSSSHLLHFVGSTFYIEAGVPHKFIRSVKQATLQNICRQYGSDMTQDKFENGQLRFLRSPPDVVYIDSLYRNRDMYAARRGDKKLVKLWDADSTTLRDVASWNE